MNWTPAYVNRWNNGKYKKLSPDAKLVFEYLTSNSATTSSGIYPLDIEAAAADTGIHPDKLLAGLEELAAPRRSRSSFIKYDGAVVWVVGQWKHAVNQGPNHKNAVGFEFTRAPRFPFWVDFFARYSDLLDHCLTAKRFSGRDTFTSTWDLVKVEKQPKIPAYKAPTEALPSKP